MKGLRDGVHMNPDSRLTGASPRLASRAIKRAKKKKEAQVLGILGNSFFIVIFTKPLAKARLLCSRHNHVAVASDKRRPARPPVAATTKPSGLYLSGSPGFWKLYLVFCLACDFVLFIDASPARPHNRRPLFFFAVGVFPACVHLTTTTHTRPSFPICRELFFKKDGPGTCGPCRSSHRARLPADSPSHPFPLFLLLDKTHA